MKKIKEVAKSSWPIAVFLILTTVVLVQVFIFGQPIKNSSRLESEIVHVVRVIDGDTVELLDGRLLRYIGINAPEKGNPYSVESKESNQRMVEGRDIKVVYDVEKEDHYGRLLGYAYSDGVFINLELIRNGLAESYIIEPNDKHEAEFKLAELDAKQERRGIWSVLK